MKSTLKGLILLVVAVCSFATSRAQAVADIQIAPDMPDFSDGYGFTKDFTLGIVNMGETVTIPAGTFYIYFGLPTNATVDYGTFDIPVGFELLEPYDETGFALVNLDEFEMTEFQEILVTIPILPTGAIPEAPGDNVNYTAEIDIDPNPTVVLDKSTTTNYLIIGTMSVPDNVDPLPVNFLSFVASGNDCKVNLEWKTSNETRTGSFAVERSHNGADYTTLTEVKAIEAATATLDYAYTDAQPLNGTSFYRIRQMDMEGKSTYSQARMIYGDCDNANVRMYPNPASDYILVDGIQAGSQIVVYNVLGQVIISKEASAANERINLSEIAAGSYTLNVVKGNNIVFSGKLLKK